MLILWREADWVAVPDSGGEAICVPLGGGGDLAAAIARLGIGAMEGESLPRIRGVAGLATRREFSRSVKGYCIVRRLPGGEREVVGHRRRAAGGRGFELAGIGWRLPASADAAGVARAVQQVRQGRVPKPEPPAEQCVGDGCDAIFETLARSACEGCASLQAVVIGTAALGPAESGSPWECERQIEEIRCLGCGMVTAQRRRELQIHSERFDVLPGSWQYFIASRGAER